eukprot:TRINITY_DN5383_c0_g1_i1.p2 TRINITY_DN5383_c0_g1~~TRINITY_DN5383_c0_g1_i1.p2  ORF type:complete len:53 (+),score=20.70 TRINITY_DN5383_c0_g1_i1:127-285(+)
MGSGAETAENYGAKERVEEIEKEYSKKEKSISSHVLCVDTGRSSETAKAHRG